jgi:hypothetical protein
MVSTIKIGAFNNTLHFTLLTIYFNLNPVTSGYTWFFIFITYV